MRQALIITFSLVLLVTIFCTSASGIKSAKASSITPIISNPQDWELVYSDNFDGPTLSEMWQGNYLPYWSWDIQDTSTTYDFENGNLVLKIEENAPYWMNQYKATGIMGGIRDYNHIFNPDYTNRVHKPTFDTYVTKYGYFEMRAKVPGGSGLCPAWWMIGFQDEKWQNAEIDIFEILGNKPDDIYFTLHALDDPNLNKQTVTVPAGQDLSQDFHVYGLEWDPNYLRLYLDGVQVAQFNQSPDYRMQTIISLNHNDNSDWYGPIDPNMPYPVRYEVDYFRVYKNKNIPTASPITTRDPRENKALDAYVSVVGMSGKDYKDFPPYLIKDGISDGQEEPGFVSNANVQLPQYIYFDWNEPQTFNTMTLKSNFCQSQAPTLYDIEVSDDGETGWTTVASNITPNWQYNDATVEFQTTFFNTVYDKKYLRVKIRDANRVWSGRYAITEIEIRQTNGTEPFPVEENHALSATASTTFGTLSGYNINSINNGDATDSWSSTTNESLPEYITLDLGTNTIDTNRMTLLTHFGEGQGITNVDVEYYDGTQWVSAASNIRIEWNSNTGLEENKDIRYPTVTTSKIRLKVNDANRQWGNISINELKLWGWE